MWLRESKRNGGREAVPIPVENALILSVSVNQPYTHIQWSYELNNLEVWE